MYLQEKRKLHKLHKLQLKIYFSKGIDTTNISDPRKNLNTLRLVISIKNSKISNRPNFRINGNSEFGVGSQLHSLAHSLSAFSITSYITIRQLI